MAAEAFDHYNLDLNKWVKANKRPIFFFLSLISVCWFTRASNPMKEVLSALVINKPIQFSAKNEICLQRFFFFFHVTYILAHFPSKVTRQSASVQQLTSGVPVAHIQMKLFWGQTSWNPLNLPWAFKRTRLELLGPLVWLIRPLWDYISCFTAAALSVRGNAGWHWYRSLARRDYRAQWRKPKVARKVDYCNGVMRC